MRISTPQGSVTSLFVFRMPCLGSIKAIHQALCLCIACVLLVSCDSSNNSNNIPTDDNAQPILNSENYERIVEVVLNTYTGKNDSRTILSGDEFLHSNEPLSSSQIDTDTTVNHYSCENDGTVSATVLRTGNFRNRIEANFNNCLWRGKTLSGEMVLNQRDQRFYSSGGDYSFSEYNVVDANDDKVSFQGAVTHTVNSADQNDTHIWHNKLDSFVYTSTTGTRELSNVDARLFFCLNCLTVAPHSGISGSFTVKSPETGHNLLTVTSPIDFENNASAGGIFTVGKLRIEAADGSYIELNADNDNPAEVSVLIAADDSMTKFPQPWKTWLYDFNFEVPAAEHQLTAKQRNALPGDCHFDFDEQGVVYCFSAPTRKFVSINPDGSVNWDFPLPGENASNNIENVSVINNDNVCIVADVTLHVGDSKHEVSCFELSGAFLDTQATLEPLPRIGDPVKPRDPLAINLDNESLKIVSDGSSLYLAGSMYQLIMGADPTLRDSWVRNSGFVSRVHPATGRVLAWHSFPSAKVNQLSLQGNQGIAVGVVPENDSPGNYVLNLETLAKTDQLDESTVLNVHNLPLWLPEAYKAITGQAIQQVEDQLLSINERIISELYFGEDNFCISNTQPEGCEYFYAPQTQTSACPISGSASVTMSGESSIQGATHNHTTTAVWDFLDCVLVPVNDDSEIPLHSLNGNWRFNTFRFITTSYEGTTITSNFNDLETVSTHGAQSVTSAELINTDRRISSSGDWHVYRDGVVNQYIDIDVHISNTKFGYHIERTQSNGEWVALEYFGDGGIDATLSTQVTNGEKVRIEVPEINGTTGIQAGYLNVIDSNYIFGSMTLTAEDDSAFNLLAFESRDGDGSEVFEYQASGTNAAESGRIPSASFYFPYFVTGNDQL